MKNNVMDKRYLLILIIAVFALTAITGCANGLKEAKEIKEGPMPQKYISTKAAREYEPSNGSLWRDNASFFEDRRARRVNDLVTIVISESTSASKKATTNAKSDSKAAYEIDNIFGMSTNWPLHKYPLIKGLYGEKEIFSTSVEGSSKSNFSGAGDTTRQGKLTGIITAKVVDVFPNGNMVVESRKEVIVNNEKEILVLRGIIRLDDISYNNTIGSQYVADAQIYMVGDGVLDDKQSQGWLVRFLDKVWPF